MTDDRFFMDTVFVQAVLDRNDQWHAIARKLQLRVQSAKEVLITEAILIEVGNALSVKNRTGAVSFIELCYRTANVRVIEVDSTLLLDALSLYRDRPDKRWGLTDCISFVVMREHGLINALTADEHFVQAGFRALMREGT